MKLKIGFSKPKKLFPILSWLIRLFEWTPYSHVFVRWHSLGADADIVYQAGGTSVNFMAGRIFDSKAETVYEYEIEVDRETYKKLLHYCMTNAGVDYGIKQVFGIALVKLFRLKKNPFADGKKSQVCSELAGNIIENLDMGDITIDLDVAGPKDIEKFLESSDRFKKLTPPGKRKG